MFIHVLPLVSLPSTEKKVYFGIEYNGERSYKLIRPHREKIKFMKLNVELCTYFKKKHTYTHCNFNQDR